MAAEQKQDKTGKPPVVGLAEPAQSFVCRDPVLDREKRIAGYQFSLPEAVAQRLQSDFEFLQKIYDDAVLRNLTSLGGEALLGRVSATDPSSQTIAVRPIASTIAATRATKSA